MSKIFLLSNSLINKIAAGEVVERPASVVKELVENSIDALATIVTVEINDGGTTQIRISDNGTGIPREDLKQAFLRHATSKITSLGDLEKVLTLGFRGEALSSICAVSQMEMVTKTSEDSSGAHIEVHGGQVISETNVASTNGTTITVRNLFYNTPARRKFLKKSSTESGYVSDIINKIALGHPELSIKYINNGSVILHTNGKKDLKTVIYHIYGKEVAQGLIPLNISKNGFDISGFIGRPNISRANRTYENFFINGRYIHNNILSKAIEEAYKTRMPSGKFPVCVLNFKVDPTEVDVNVHPTKLEVRFSNEDDLYDTVYEAVDKALKGETLIPTQIVKEDLPSAKVIVTPKPLPNPYPQKMKFSESPIAVPIELNEVYEEEKPPHREAVHQAVKETAKPKFFQNYKIIGQVFYCYWIIEQKDSLYLIDQHAAHERILYEELTARFKDKLPASQRLVIPEVVHLSQSEKETLRDNNDLIKGFGFEISEGVDSEFFIEGVPYIFNKPSATGFFTEILDKLRDIGISIDNIYEMKADSIATMACKAAVKASDKLSYQEAVGLIDKILKLENPFTCPHGRPTIVEITKYEIEKMFKR